MARVQAEVGPVDMLVDNAGVTRDAMLHKMSFEQRRELIDVDLGAVSTCAGPWSKACASARSVASSTSVPSNGLSGQVGQANYDSTNAGVIVFTRSLALEGASRNITANAIEPG